MKQAKKLIGVVIGVFLLTGCATMYGEMSPEEMAQEIYTDAYVTGRVVGMKFPDYAEDSYARTQIYLAAADPVAAFENDADAAQGWYDSNKATDVALWWSARKVFLAVGGRFADDWEIDLTYVDPELFKAALRGYNSGLKAQLEAE